jgi:hypothetical protein
MELIFVLFSFLTGQAIPEFENPRSAYSRWVTAFVRYSGLCDNGKRKQSDDRLPHKLGGPRSLEVSRSLCKEPILGTFKMNLAFVEEDATECCYS